MQETQETWVQSLGWEDPLEEKTAPCSSILAWEIPWTEEPGGLQSVRSQRVAHDWEAAHAQVGTKEAERLLVQSLFFQLCCKEKVISRGWEVLGVHAPEPVFVPWETAPPAGLV